MNRRVVAVSAGLLLLAGLGWALIASQPRLTSITTGTTLCVPANSEGQAMFGYELLHNQTGSPPATFEPDRAAGISVIGAYLLPDSEPPPGVLNDPELVPHGFTFEPVAPGVRATLVIGVQLDDPSRAGRFTGGVLRGQAALPFHDLGRSTTGYQMVPFGQTCEMD